MVIISLSLPPLKKFAFDSILFAFSCFCTICAILQTLILKIIFVLVTLAIDESLQIHHFTRLTMDLIYCLSVGSSRIATPLLSLLLAVFLLSQLLLLLLLLLSLS